MFARNSILMTCYSWVIRMKTNRKRIKWPVSGTSRMCTGKSVTCSVVRAVMQVCLHSSCITRICECPDREHTAGVVSWALSLTHQVLYLISSHNVTSTRCYAHTNSSHLISSHMWPGVTHTNPSHLIHSYDVLSDPKPSPQGISVWPQVRLSQTHWQFPHRLTLTCHLIRDL